MFELDMMVDRVGIRKRDQLTLATKKSILSFIPNKPPTL